jgi:hypothetical protein
MNDWINNNLGRVHLNPQPPHGIQGQCVNLASSWSLYQGGPELMGDTAWHIWQNFRHPFYQVVTGAPQAGDIAFFLPNNPSAGTGSAGHVDVVVEVTGFGFKGLDTDWNQNPKSQYVNHSLTGVAGYFRHQGETMSTVDLTIGRIAYYALWGQNGQNGTPNALDGSLDADIQKNWVGHETNEFINTFFNAPQGDAYRKLAASLASEGTKLNPGKYIV